ncbi:hypothetical protein WMF45_15315 [Sorangium sp. So ce448]|uniref:hypothetical protein n=1 Tax=Sorangium sp. So ce448 TaxID=3133314 RepID=UPI003F62DD18
MATVIQPGVVNKILACLALPTEPSPRAPLRAPTARWGQADLAGNLCQRVLE